jgi:hypothetical protein
MGKARYIFRLKSTGTSSLAILEEFDVSRDLIMD